MAGRPFRHPDLAELASRPDLARLAAAALVDAAVATALDRVLPTGSATQVLSVDLCFVRSVPLDREVETAATVFHVRRRLAVVDAEISPAGGTTQRDRAGHRRPQYPPPRAGARTTAGQRTRRSHGQLRSALRTRANRTPERVRHFE